MENIDFNNIIKKMTDMVEHEMESNKELVNDVYQMIDSSIQGVCCNLLELNGIKSGDISPDQLLGIEEAQVKLAEVIALWMQSRIDEGEE